MTNQGSKEKPEGAGAEEQPILTNRQGHPVYDNQNMRTVGDRGPTVLENYQFLEKITHFDRERIPERVVHARGAGAHAIGLRADCHEPASKYTRAKLFQEKGKRTPVFVRFSTVIHGGHSPENLRDPRGFAIKFYTADGNWDLVGNNLKIFFIRDPVKFPDVVHAYKPDPVTIRQLPNRIFDLISLAPESMHMLTWLFSPRGIPANYRTQDGFGVNTTDGHAEGVGVLAYHWIRAGRESLTQKRPRNHNFNTHQTSSTPSNAAIPHGSCAGDPVRRRHPELDFDPPTTQNLARRRITMLPSADGACPQPTNYFPSDSGLRTGRARDGLDFPTQDAAGRTFSYADTQRHRVGANYLQCRSTARIHVATNQRDGQMTYHVRRRGGREPPSTTSRRRGGLKEATKVGKDQAVCFMAGRQQEISGLTT